MILERIVELTVTQPLWRVSATGALLWWAVHFALRPWALLP